MEINCNNEGMNLGGNTVRHAYIMSFKLAPMDINSTNLHLENTLHTVTWPGIHNPTFRPLGPWKHAFLVFCFSTLMVLHSGMTNGAAALWYTNVHSDPAQNKHE